MHHGPKTIKNHEECNSEYIIRIPGITTSLFPCLHDGSIHFDRSPGTVERTTASCERQAASMSRTIRSAGQRVILVVSSEQHRGCFLYYSGQHAFSFIDEMCLGGRMEQCNVWNHAGCALSIFSLDDNRVGCKSNPRFTRFLVQSNPLGCAALNSAHFRVRAMWHQGSQHHGCKSNLPAFCSNSPAFSIEFCCVLCKGRGIGWFQPPPGCFQPSTIESTRIFCQFTHILVHSTRLHNSLSSVSFFTTNCHFLGNSQIHLGGGHEAPWFNPPSWGARQSSHWRLGQGGFQSNQVDPTPNVFCPWPSSWPFLLESVTTILLQILQLPRPATSSSSCRCQSSSFARMHVISFASVWLPVNAWHLTFWGLRQNFPREMGDFTQCICFPPCGEMKTRMLSELTHFAQEVPPHASECKTPLERRTTMPTFMLVVESVVNHQRSLVRTLVIFWSMSERFLCLGGVSMLTVGTFVVLCWLWCTLPGDKLALCVISSLMIVSSLSLVLFCFCCVLAVTAWLSVEAELRSQSTDSLRVRCWDFPLAIWLLMTPDSVSSLALVSTANDFLLWLDCQCPQVVAGNGGGCPWQLWFAQPPSWLPSSEAIAPWPDWLHCGCWCWCCCWQHWSVGGLWPPPQSLPCWPLNLPELLEEMLREVEMNLKCSLTDSWVVDLSLNTISSWPVKRCHNHCELTHFCPQWLGPSVCSVSHPIASCDSILQLLSWSPSCLGCFFCQGCCRGAAARDASGIDVPSVEIFVVDVVFSRISLKWPKSGSVAQDQLADPHIFWNIGFDWQKNKSLMLMCAVGQCRSLERSVPHASQRVDMRVSGRQPCMWKSSALTCLGKEQRERVERATHPSPPWLHVVKATTEIEKSHSWVDSDFCCAVGSGCNLEVKSIALLEGPKRWNAQKANGLCQRVPPCKDVNSCILWCRQIRDWGQVCCCWRNWCPHQP